MERRKRTPGPRAGQDAGQVAGIGGKQPEHGQCVVCGLRDTRMLVTVTLTGGAEAILCGSHALLHGRTGAASTTIAELRGALVDRRETNRRGRFGEGDELGERLIAAFTRERRGPDRRMN